jgi:hypothetical protein
LPLEKKTADMVPSGLMVVMMAMMMMQKDAINRNEDEDDARVSGSGWERNE